MRARYVVAPVAVLLLTLGVSSINFAQAAGDAASAPVAQIDVSYVHPGFAGAVIVHPRRLLDSAIVKGLPQEMVAPAIENLRRQTTIDPHNIDRVMILVGPPAADGDVGIPFTPGVVLTFHDPVDQKQLSDKLAPGAVAAEFGGKRYLRGAKNPPEGLYFADARTVVFAPEKSLQKMLAAGGGKGPLAEALAKADPQHDLLAVGVMEPVKQMFQAAAQGAREQLPDKLKGLVRIPDHLKSAALTADASGEHLLKLTMEGNDEDGANSLQSYAIVGRDFTKSIVAAMRPTLQQGMPPEVAAPVAKMIDDLMAGFKIKQDGIQVIISLKTPEGWQDLPKTLSPIIEQQRKRADAMRRLNGLRMLGIAMHLQHDTTAKLPASAIADKQGQPLLSWRVKLLPYLEAKWLYDQFHLDEPWDSEHNRKLVEKMPSVYGRSKEGKTSVFVFAGEGTVFPPGKSLTFGEITDGMSRTILLVEAGEDKAVPWTKPEDLAVDNNNPAAALGKLPDGKFPAVFCDVHLEMLDSKMEPAQLRSLILPTDGGPAGLRDPGQRPARLPSGPGRGAAK